MRNAVFYSIVVLGAVMSIGGAFEGEQGMDEKREPAGIATFAGGCFWCSESDFERIPGVVRVVSGYTGGHTENPTYEEVCSGKTGHYEAVQVHYDPSRVSYERLLEVFWRHIDPTDPGGQFADRGSQYRTAIFYHNGEQRALADASKKALAASGRFGDPIVTEIKEFTFFYEAEDYHQDYHRTCPVRYKMYRSGSGRDRFIEEIWGGEEADGGSVEGAPGSGVGAAEAPRMSGSEAGGSFGRPDERTIRASLTPVQYRVTQECGTEPPFDNAFWNDKREGIYVDVVSGEPLFASTDKFDSGTGWPSFIRPLMPDNIVEREDSSHGMVRTEVRSRHGDSHLGHLFPDGPAPTGLRYCINSASLRFIPREDLEKEGYGEYLRLFEKD